MANTKTYSEQQNIIHTRKLNELLNILPEFCKDFFSSIEYTKTARTKVAYAMDLKGFFEYLVMANPTFSSYSIKNFKLNGEIDLLDSNDLLEYLRHVKLYSKEW